MSQSAPTPIELTSDAALKIKELIAEEDNPNLKLRVYITGGGCSGFQYGFAFEESANDDDMTIERDGVQVVVDPMSLQYLFGAEISYDEGIQGAQFTINNPNAQTTCGCGASFSVAE